MNDATRHEPAERDGGLLFSTENGWVRHCACRDVLVIGFLGYWMAVSRDQYRDFHGRLIGAVRCPLARARLAQGGRVAFRGHAPEPLFTAGRAELEELLWLLDSARFMLEARDAARAGFAAARPLSAASRPFLPFLPFDDAPEPPR